jgi:hypothetical protein
MTLARAALAGATLLLAAPAPAAAREVKVEVVTPESIAAKRKAIVQENLPLTPEQARLFWPLYDGYRAEREATYDERTALFGRFFDATKKLDGPTAKALLDDAQALDRRDLDTRARWIAKMTEALPAPVVLRWAQIENKIDVSLRFWLAEQLPLVIDGKPMRVGVAGGKK